MRAGFALGCSAVGSCLLVGLELIAAAVLPRLRCAFGAGGSAGGWLASQLRVARMQH